jgi:hypothetical protein
VRFVLPTGLGRAPVIEPISDAEITWILKDSMVVEV